MLEDPKTRRARHERIKKAREELIRDAVEPWDLMKTKWKPKQAFRADTWLKWDLFDVEATANNNPNWEKHPAGKFELSPSGKYMFCKKLLPRAEGLLTINGKKTGEAVFDADITIPALHELSDGRRGCREGSWFDEPWMSITPMELMTQRPGIRFAKGHVIVAGLGIGWFLTQVRLKKTVKKVTLVEQSQELVDWLLTSDVIFHAAQKSLGIQSHQLAPLEIVVDDAYKAIPKMTADVALIDIYEGYGGNDFLDDLRSYRGNTLLPEEKKCPNIGRIWDWGRQFTRESYW